ncbi:MAG: hypothetical protein IPK68_06695 [Bdellovibrionales bacterium]|nr:hypothetical protein [Bdellovibrionales bacterium]
MGGLCWLLSPCAFAAITIHSISGVSNWVKEGGSVIVYGGFAGSEGTGCTSNSDGTCNNCILGTGPLACNEKRAMLNSDVEISVSSDSLTKSGPILLTSGDGITKIGSNGTTVGKGETGVVKIPWTTICASAFSAYAASACVSSTSATNASPPAQTLKIGVDADGNGQLGSGEGDSIIFKVHMPSVQTPSNTAAIREPPLLMEFVPLLLSLEIRRYSSRIWSQPKLFPMLETFSFQKPAFTTLPWALPTEPRALIQVLILALLISISKPRTTSIFLAIILSVD